MTDPATSNIRLPIELFDYPLPADLIAQEPLQRREDSRLLVLDRASRDLEHAHFRDIATYLDPGSLLVINDSRVLKARLVGRRESGGRIEFLLLEPCSEFCWLAMARPVRRLRAGERLELLVQDDESSGYHLSVLEKHEDGRLVVELPKFDEIEPLVGRTPLPHYISAPLSDPERYQTVYARDRGSVAAPTAGLHFTRDLIKQLEDRGIEFARITLHVGPGTFQPIKVDDAAQHQMHSERFHVEQDALRKIRRAQMEGRRIVAVGTTSCRTLETIADRLDHDGDLVDTTDIYITPGYSFRLVGGLITNFHLPQSTLLLLVSAFAGRCAILDAYAEAITRRYRFYSFGDAMYIR